MIPAGLVALADGFWGRDPAFADPLDPDDRAFSPIPDAWTARPIADLFLEVARRHPDRVAAEDGDRALTYGQVRALAGGVGAALAEAPGEAAGPVALVLHDGLQFLPIVLALFASGRVFTVIDPSHPFERRRAILDQVRPGLILTTAGAPDEDMADASVPRLVLDMDALPDAPLTVADIDMDAPCGLVFTSGSTGVPKGVAASQRAYLEYLQEYVNTLRIGPDDCLLSVATLSAAGARECLAAVLTGARVRVLDFRAAGLMGAFAALQDATILTFVPSVMRAIAAVPGLSDACRRLRVLNFISEPLLAPDLPLIRPVLPAGCLISLEFGATETTSIFRWFVREDAVTGSATPSGYLVPGQEIAVVDEDGQPVPAGEAGELIVRSRRVGRGLWRDGALTPGPFQPLADGVCLYQTGDLVRLGPDGLAAFAGRRDRQIKIRGLQVDLAEVEAALRDQPGVEDAVALPVAAVGEAARLIAFVSGRALDPQILRRQIAAIVADHGVPARIFVLDVIPRLATHKPDLVRLQALALGAGSS